MPRRVVAALPALSLRLAAWPALTPTLVNIEAKGRTTVLKINYRNTAQILGFARRFAADVLGAPGLQADDESAVLMPEDGGRQGVEPEVGKCVNFEGEAHATAEWLLARKQAGYDWPQMAVLYPEHAIGDRLAGVFAKHGIPVDVAKANKNRVSVDKPACGCCRRTPRKGSSSRAWRSAASAPSAGTARRSRTTCGSRTSPSRARDARGVSDLLAGVAAGRAVGGVGDEALVPAVALMCRDEVPTCIAPA